MSSVVDGRVRPVCRRCLDDAARRDTLLFRAAGVGLVVLVMVVVVVVVVAAV